MTAHWLVRKCNLFVDAIAILEIFMELDFFEILFHCLLLWVYLIIL